MTEDSALVARLEDRNPDTFAAIYDRFAGLVYGLARRILQNDVQAEDVTQSIFLSLWANPSAFRGGNFGAWIARVARNAAIDVLRSAAVRTRAPEMPLQLASPTALDEVVFDRLRSESVTEALKALPDEQRRPIEIAYFQGLSYRDVAERLGEPVGTIKSRIRAGLRRMGQALSGITNA